MNQRYVTSGSRLALAISVLGFACATASAQETTPPTNSAEGEQPNAIVVSGVRQSIETAIDDKRRASEIKDSITAEDIGQLANENISEALQRITGVQVIRGNDGEGKNVQIRGLSENNVTINGATASGTGDVDLSNGNDRSVNFQDLSPELFSGVEILKALAADQIEGSLGGTINLQTRAPLKGKRDLVVNLSATNKYAEVGRLWNQDANLFVQKKFLDTPLGDFGVIINAGYKEIGSYAYVYGGGEFEDAPGIWVRKTGDVNPPASQGTSQTNANYNYFLLPTVPVLNSTGGNTSTSLPNPYQYAFDDPNGDGLSDSRDVYYIPGTFGTSERVRDDRRKSLNATLQWKPANNLDIRFDTVLTDINQNLTGANSNLVSNVPRSGYLIGGPGTTFAQLGSTPTFGNVYVLTAGRLASFSTRVGAAPSINETLRDSQQYSLEATWDVTPNLSIYAKGSTSKGKATTANFGQLSAGIEHQGGTGANGQFNTQDFYNIVDFNLGSGMIPNVTLYESPFPSLNYPVKSVVPEANLVKLTPGDLSYNRYRYFQFQRNAADTENTDDAIRFDVTWKPDAGLLKALKVGFRWAERGFARARYENQSQTGSVFTAWDGTRPPLQAVGIQNVPVNPANATSPDAAATSTFLLQCLSKAGNPNVLARFGGNYPLTYDSTAGCDISAVQNYFNMIDIRAVNPATGAGYYEIRQERFDISEKTVAGYLRADFETALGGIDLFGNVGVRYVKTDTSSTGYLQNPISGPTRTYSLITVKNQYDDWLPSANFNFGFSKDLIARLAYSRTLGRPSLVQISTGLDVTRTDTDPVYAGSGKAGNPFLKPVHSDNFDLSLEWYYAKGSYLSVAAFAKNIDTTIFLSPTPVDYDLNGELFSVVQYQNFGGTKLKGVELGMAHAFKYLPGVLRHLGVTGNFTYIDENSSLRDQEGDPISRKGLSKYNYNLSGYYDDGRFSLRLAYNWRSAFTRRETAPLGFARLESLPETEAARGQLDLAARFTLNRNVRFSFNAINLTNTGTVRYLKYPILVNYLSVAGRKYTLGASVSF
ncbi:MAG: TonB-dependent receptor [Sphingomonadaceae bacterium]|nr:TonB-dependent receptor [Sphingomonadaceae bacterium]